MSRVSDTWYTIGETNKAMMDDGKVRMTHFLPTLDQIALSLAVIADNLEKYNVKGVIDNQPTVNAVEVVRCKDCKWSAKTTINSIVPLFCELEDKAVFCHDYCSYGERKGIDVD